MTPILNLINKQHVRASRRAAHWPCGPLIKDGRRNSSVHIPHHQTRSTPWIEAILTNPILQLELRLLRLSATQILLLSAYHLLLGEVASPSRKQACVSNRFYSRQSPIVSIHPGRSRTKSGGSVGMIKRPSVNGTWHPQRMCLTPTKRL